MVRAVAQKESPTPGRFDARAYAGCVSSGRAFVVYTLLRILLLVAVGGLLYLLGARGLVLIILAFLVSGALSLVWLDKPRSQASQGLGRAIGKINDKIDAAAAKEDEPRTEDVEPDADSRGQAETESEAGQQKSQ